MTYQVAITASSGCFDTTFESKPDIKAMVRMVSSGAQVRQGWSIIILDRHTKAAVSANGDCITGMPEAVDCLLAALSHMPKRPRAADANYDVTVPVCLAVDGSYQLVDVEDFVRKAVNVALDAHAEGVLQLGHDTAMMYNGDTVQIGSAKAD
jgi:hypothetical protein